MMVNINFRIESRLRERFQSKCRKAGEVPSQVLRRLISDYVSGKIIYQTTQEIVRDTRS